MVTSRQLWCAAFALLTVASTSHCSDGRSKGPAGSASPGVNVGQTGSPGERDVCASEVWLGADEPTRKASCGVHKAEPNAKDGSFTFYCSCDTENCAIDPDEGAPLKSCAKELTIEENETAPCPRAMRQGCGIETGWVGFCKGAGLGDESVCWPSDGGFYTCRCPGGASDVRTSEKDCQKASNVCLTAHAEPVLRDR